MPTTPPIRRLRIAGRIDRYVATLFVAAYATSFLLVVGLVLVLDLASNLRYFEPWPSGDRASTADILRYYLLSVPFLYLQVAPFVTVVAGMFCVSRLVKHNELTAALAAGVSAQRVLAPIFLGGALVAGGMFFLREEMTRNPRIGPVREALRDMLEERRRERVFTSVWLRDRFTNVVRLAEFRPATGGPGEAPYAEIVGLEATLPHAGVVRLVRATRAVYVSTPEGPRWWLENGMIEEYGAAGTRRPLQYLEGVDFSPRDVLTALRGEERAMELSFSEIDHLARRDPDNAEYQTLLHHNLTFPLANLVLLLVALPFMVGRERGRHIEGLVAGCLLAIFYFAFDFITRSMGVDGTLSPLLSSWLPVLLFGSLGVVLFESMRS